MIGIEIECSYEGTALEFNNSGRNNHDRLLDESISCLGFGSLQKRNDLAGYMQHI
jgi:hypothetical protein